MANHAGIC